MSTTTRKPRVDRDRNRARLLVAASEAVRRHGLDVSMRAIARDAGVGVATAHRHFPVKADLLEAVLASRVAECERVLRLALDEPDPWRALTMVVGDFAELQITDPGLLRILLDASGDHAPFAEARREHAVVLERLFRNAAKDGALLPGASIDDVRVGMIAMTAFSRMSAERSAAAIRRLRDLVLRGIANNPERTSADGQSTSRMS